MPKWLQGLLDLIQLALTGRHPPDQTTTLAPTTQRPLPTTLGPDGPPPIPPPTPPPSSVAQQLLAAHNQYRAARGLRPLTLDTRLMASAQGHADWMATTGNFSHTGAGGSSPFDRMRAAGYQYSAAGENIALGYQDAVAVMKGWIASPGHEANIRGPYANVGFGYNSRGPRWVADFGMPLGGVGAAVPVESAPGPLISVSDITDPGDQLELEVHQSEPLGDRDAMPSQS